MTRATGRLAALLLLLTAASPLCGQSQRGGGVPVVTNPAPPAAAAPWTVAARPAFSVGGAPDDPRYQLLEVSDATRLSDGRIVVANGGTGELQVYGARGEHLASVGRSGDGPGEFRRIASLQRGPGDTLLVFDRQHQRVSVLTARGTLARSLALGEQVQAQGAVGRFADGRWYARSADRMRPGADGALLRDTVGFALLSADLGRPATFARLPGMVTASFRGLGGEPGIRTAPFSPFAVHSVFERCLYVSSGEGFDVWLFSSAGRPVRQVRNPWPRQRATAAHGRAWRDAMLQHVPAEARQPMQAVLAAIPLPAALPALHALHVDALGYVWLQQYAVPFGPGRDWIVLAPDGRAFGRVRLPVALEVFEIGADYLLGRWRNDDGEEFVQLYPLSRPARAPAPGACG